jgi:glycine dehydrogenase subunit 2
MGAMLVEPTESESRASLDLFIAALRDLGLRRPGRQARSLQGGAPVRAAPRLDERARRASRCLKWTPPPPYNEAAE